VPVWEELAEQQDGVLTRSQALAGGLTDAQIERRLRGGRWQRLFGRVYATYSGKPSRGSLLWAVVLRAGRGAVLSHETAAELAGLTDRPAKPVHVTVPANRRIVPIPGAVVHISSRVAEARHPTRLPPQTRIEETVLDLSQQARCLDDALGWAAIACGRRLTTAQRLLAAMRRRAKLRWRTELAAALGEVGSGCHSLLELRYLRDVERRHGLPTGTRQAVSARRGGRRYDDVRYDGYQTRVELDGRIAHPEDRRPDDRRRDNAGTIAGDSTLRFGWGDVTEAPCDVAADVATVLHRHGWTAMPRACGAECVIAKGFPARARENPSRSSGDTAHGSRPAGAV
jgi:hypothetical protein